MSRYACFFAVPCAVEIIGSSLLCLYVLECCGREVDVVVIEVDATASAN